MPLTLWHCHRARSLRALWSMEEMGLAREVVSLPFPPRVHQRSFLAINPLGTVPYFVDRRDDSEVHMTESSAICHYLAERYDEERAFSLDASHPEYGDYLNWLHHADATLTFPQTLVLRYGQLEPHEHRPEQVLADYRKWYFGRLRRLGAHLEAREYLCDGRFTIADIAVGYALFFGDLLELSDEYSAQIQAYKEPLKAREALRVVGDAGIEISLCPPMFPDAGVAEMTAGARRRY